MRNTRECQACGKIFTPDRRNGQKQTFCAKQQCQQRRRTLRQKLRRHHAALPGASAVPQPTAQTALSGPQKASVLSKVDFGSENPVIIGLISMLIGSDDIDEVEAAYRRFKMRGIQIASLRSMPSSPNSQIINIFDEFRRAGKTSG